MNEQASAMPSSKTTQCVAPQPVVVQQNVDSTASSKTSDYSDSDNDDLCMWLKKFPNSVLLNYFLN